ncbi:MAG: hypothetical protein D6720_01315 [Gammaproteobacteria bacterium]|nr:MAG: hypothetical protein D6720_01315 [Gammaproteobacteria bacterium]
MCRLCWILTLLFATATGVLAWKFILQGETVPANDGRTAILLTEGERDLVLSEMRAFLAAVQQVLDASVRGDVDAVASAARAVGMATRAGVPDSLVGKLPLAFKKLGFATHEAFDRLALDTEALGDTREVPETVAGIMRNCVACHASYRLKARADAVR